MSQPTEPGRPAFSLEDPQTALHSLTAFAQSMLSQNSLEDLLWDIAQKVGELLGFEDCVVYLATQERLVQSAAFGVKHPGQRQIRDPIVIAFGQGIVGAAAASCAPLRVADTNADPRYIRDSFSGRSELAVPITFAGRVLGVLDSESKMPGRFTATDEAMFVAIATLAAPRIASALAERDHTEAVAALHSAQAAHSTRVRRLREEHTESLAQLAGGIAHDFNNLLSTILGNISLAQVHGTSPAVGMLLDDAVDGCLRARTLTQQLIAFVRGGEPAMTADNLASTLRASVDFARREHDLEVTFDLPDSLRRVRFNGSQLTQVFHNLTANAGQAQDRGRLHITARDVERNGIGHVEIRFHDAGPGVPEPLRQRIFDPYFTTKEHGTGLGLATSYWIVRGHGGQLELDPQAGGGACFVVRLPHNVVRVDPGQDRRTPALRILLMHDDAAQRRALETSLLEVGHVVDVAMHSDECVQRYVRAAVSDGERFDVVLLRHTMVHGADGPTTLRILRAADPAIRAVLLVDRAEQVPPAAASGFVGRLDAPYDADRIDAVLDPATWSDPSAPGAAAPAE